MNTLFTPLKMGASELANRVFMAPLTRVRADADHVPTDMMVEYYAQRASAGLIIAAVAVLLKLTTGKAGPRRAQYAGGETDESGITLEAHRTARGWTVEPR